MQACLPEVRRQAISKMTDPNDQSVKGSRMVATKQPPEPPKEKKEFDRGSTIKDSFAIMASAATTIRLTSQVKK